MAPKTNRQLEQIVATQAAQIKLARDALERLSLYIAYNGDDWVQKEAQEAIAALDSAEYEPVSAQNKVDAELYQELLYHVETKHPGETRHETALRYIKNAENRSCNTAQKAREGK